MRTKKENTRQTVVEHLDAQPVIENPDEPVVKQKPKKIPMLSGGIEFTPELQKMQKTKFLKFLKTYQGLLLEKHKKYIERHERFKPKPDLKQFEDL